MERFRLCRRERRFARGRPGRGGVKNEGLPAGALCLVAFGKVTSYKALISSSESPE